MGTCIAACTHNPHDPSEVQKRYIEPQASQIIRNQLESTPTSSEFKKGNGEKDHADEESTFSQTNKIKDQQSDLRQSSSLRKSRFFKKNLKNKSIHFVSQGSDDFKQKKNQREGEKKSLHKSLKPVQRQNWINKHQELKQKTLKQKPEQSILKSKKTGTSHIPAKPSSSSSDSDRRQAIIKKSGKDQKKFKITINGNSRGEIIKKQTFKDAQQEAQINYMSYESTIKDSNSIQRHKLPTLEARPLDNTSQALIKSTLNFQHPTLINIDVHFEGNYQYIGQWMDGVKYGRGRLTWPQGIYDGEWKENQMWGKGTMKFKNNESYEGSWQENQAHGDGIFKFSDGSLYRGGWKNNKQDGFGVFQWSQTQYYSGSWSQGYKNGYGELVFGDGSYYKGQFNGNQIHGEGEYYWHRKQTYRGMWHHNQKQGLGTLITQQGIKYQGQFLHDKMHGQGKMTDLDGTIYQGKWQHGKREGIINEISPDGTITRGIWYYGKYVEDYDEHRQKKKKKKKKIRSDSSLSD